MTINELCRNGEGRLLDAGNTDSAFDARCLMELALDTDTTGYLLARDNTAGPELCRSFSDLIGRRAAGEPLQYILGRWEFMGFPFCVGEGVLIPRPETEMLVEFAVGFLKDRETPVVVDLCSGSGCIAVSLARLLPSAAVYAVEKSEAAFDYLKRNIGLNGVNNVTPVLGDVSDSGCLDIKSADLILSNPPYVRRGDLPGLQSEVGWEPAMALDGGVDGLDFYRIICSEWLGLVSDGGGIALECGEDQTGSVARMLTEAGFTAQTFNDLSGLPRMVTAQK